MNSKEFIFGLSESIGTTEDIAGRLIKYVNKCLGESFEVGSGLEIPSLGYFYVESRKEKVVISPTTQKRMLMPPQNLLRFSQGRPQENIRMAELQSLADNLSKKTRLPEDIATLIVKTFFGYIQKSLQTDDNLTIDGLGTFQTADNGQTVVFTPSSKMEEIVNRPFSQFVPVAVNDGVYFSDIEGEEGISSEQDKQSQPIEVVEGTDNSVEKNTESHEENTKKTNNEIVSEPEDKPAPPQPEANDGHEISQPEEQAVSPQKKWSLSKIAAMVAVSALIVFGLGYIIGHSPNGNEGDGNNDGAQTVETASTTENAQTASNPEETIDYDKINEQVVYGAYNIVGIDTIIIAAKSQSVRDMAATFFGSEQMEMYISALNDGITMVNNGDTLRIPKLELKNKK